MKRLGGYLLRLALVPVAVCTALVVVLFHALGVMEDDA